MQSRTRTTLIGVVALLIALGVIAALFVVRDRDEGEPNPAASAPAASDDGGAGTSDGGDGPGASSAPPGKDPSGQKEKRPDRDAAKPAYKPSADPERVTEAVIDTLVGKHTTPKAAAKKLRKVSTDMFDWSLKSSDLSPFEQMAVTRVEADGDGGKTVNVFGTPEEGAGEILLFAVNLSGKTAQTDDNGDPLRWVAGIQYGADLDIDGPRPYTTIHDRELLDDAGEAVVSLIAPENQDLSKKERADMAGDLFVDPKKAAKQGPLKYKGRVLSIEKPSGVYWPSPVEETGDAKIMVSGWWMDPLNSANDGHYVYEVTPARDKDGSITLGDISQIEGPGKDNKYYPSDDHDEDGEDGPPEGVDWD